MLPYEPIFLLAGQSNMAGRCVAQDLLCQERRQQDNSSLSASNVEFLFCWNNDSNFGETTAGTSQGQWKPLQCQHSPGLNDLFLFGPEMGLAESLGERLTTDLAVSRAYFLKFAMGSTNLHSNWNPDINKANDTDKEGEKTTKAAEVGHYQRFIQFCRSSLDRLNDESKSDTPNSASPSSAVGTEAPLPKRLVGMFWLQGESDTSRAKDANAYGANLARFCEQVRHDLAPYTLDPSGVTNGNDNNPSSSSSTTTSPSSTSFPIVVSPVVWNKGKKVSVVNQALHEAGAGAVPNCICIDPIDASRLGAPMLQTANDPFVDHLTAPAVLDIGRRMGLAFPLSQLQ